MKKLLPYMKGYRIQCFLAPLFKLVEALLELFVPILVAQIIDFGIANSDKKLIINDTLIIIFLGVLGLLFSVTAQYFSAKAAIGFSTQLRSALFQKVQGFSYSRLDKIGLSSVITRLTGDVDRLQSGVNMTLRLFLRSPFLVVGSVVSAFFIDTQAAWIFMAIVPILSLIVFGVMWIGIRLYKKVQAHLDEMMRSASDQLRGARVIRAFRNENTEISLFSSIANALATLQKNTGRITALLTPGTYIVINFATILLLYVGALKIDNGILTQGEVVALYNYIAKVLVELLKLADLLIAVTKAAASVSRTAELLDGEEEEDKGTKEPEYLSHAPLLEIKNLSFTYDRTEAPALENIHFQVQPGQWIGIIGGTGSGKTTLVNLLPRFYEPSEGEILYKGVNLQKIPRKILRQKIGVVPQEAVLFRGSIRENIQWGKQDASDEEIFSALEAAQALDFVKEKSGVLDFPIEENARNLSGGQKQRLCIARALVRKPEILILDDSSSALDFATDYRLRSSLAALPYSPCVFTVSQRTTSVKNCQLILVLDDGKAVGMGTHEELLKNCLVYRQIHLSQNPEEGGEKA